MTFKENRKDLSDLGYVPGSLVIEYHDTPQEERPALLKALEAGVLTLPTRSQVLEAKQNGIQGEQELAQKYRDAALRGVRITYPNFDPDEKDNDPEALGEFQKLFNIVQGSLQEEIMTGLEIFQGQVSRRPASKSIAEGDLFVRKPGINDWKRP